jgi:predicted amidophosphoribosyltransferase
MKSAFRAVHTAEIQNSRLLLVDDVLTTGSTIQAAADTLRAADASAVDAAVFAVAAGGFQYVPANAIITSVTEG